MEPAPLSELMEPAYLVGDRIRITTILGKVLEGEVYSYDPALGIVVLQEGIEHTVIKRNIKVLNEKSIKDVQILEEGTEDSRKIVELPAAHLMTRVLEAREERNVAAIVQAENNIGVGVTPYGQMIFDGLCDIFPCRWDGKAIIVLNEVRVSEPYLPESCEGPAKIVARLKIMLKKLHTASTSKSK